MAPEVYRCLDQPDAGYGLPCDLWSLGVAIFVLLGGHLPFEGDREVNRELAAAKAQLATPKNEDEKQELTRRQVALELKARTALRVQILRGDAKKYRKRWCDVSGGASDFVARLLEQDPEKRRDALTHAWLMASDAGL